MVIGQGAWEPQRETKQPIPFIIISGKKGIAIDLKTKEGLDVILKLASNSDVVLENFRPGVVDRLGLVLRMCEHSILRYICIR